MAYPGVDKTLTYGGNGSDRRRPTKPSAGMKEVGRDEAGRFSSNTERRAESLRREASGLGATDAEDLYSRGRSPIRPRVKMGSRAY